FTTPTASVVAPGQIDCTTPSIIIDGSNSTNSLGTTIGLTYSWAASNGGNISSGGTTSSPVVNSAGDYTLTLTQSNGCTDVITVSVTADASVPVASIAAPGILNCVNATLVLDGSGSSGT